MSCSRRRRRCPSSQSPSGSWVELLRPTAELLPVQLLEWIDFRPDRVFVHKLRLNRIPPLVVGGGQLGNDFRVPGGHVCSLSRVGWHVEELPTLLSSLGLPASFGRRVGFLRRGFGRPPVAHQMPTRASHTALGVLVILR